MAERGAGSTGHNLSVCLHGHSLHGAVRTGVEASIKRTVSVQASNPIARGGAAIAESGERSTGHNLSVCLHGHSLHGAVRTGIEVGLECPIRIKSPEPAACSVPDTTDPEGGEMSAK